MNQNENYQEKSTTTRTEFGYTREDIVIEGAHGKNGEGVLNTLSGQIYKIGENSREHIGSVNGYRRGSSMSYDMAGVPTALLVSASEAVVGLEALVSGSNENQEGDEA